jgi:hypothetical protein
MSLLELSPPYSPPEALLADLRRQGFAVATSAWVAELAKSSTEELGALGASWQDMPSDAYLKDGGHYRRRRHSSFVVDQTGCRQVPHRAHFQPPQYNALHGGMLRWFAPMPATFTEHAGFGALLTNLAALFSQLRGEAQPWFVEAHQFRIDTSEGIGRPTPEGAHRDGVDFVALFMVERRAVLGGETRVFSADGPQGLRFTLSEPWSVLLLDDLRVIHESTPIRPLHADATAVAHRDTLVLTFRRGGFQDPAPAS